PTAAETIIRLVGGETLASDPRFATHEARAQNADELDSIVANWIAERDAVEIDRVFEEAGAAGMRVLSIADVFEDRHYQERASLVDVADNELGTVAIPAPVPRMSATPGRVIHAGQALGRDTEDVLEELGYTPDEIKEGHAGGAW